MQAFNNGKMVEIEDVKNSIPQSRLRPKKKNGVVKPERPMCELCGVRNETLYKRDGVWLCKPCLSKFTFLMRFFNSVVNGEDF